MAEELGGLRISIGLDGSELESGLKGINQGFKLLESQFRASGGSVKGFENTLEGLTAKHELLTGKVELQRRKIQELTNEFNDLRDSGNATSGELNRMQILINNSVGTLNRFETELRQNDQAMSNFGQESNETTRELGTLNAATVKLNGGFTVLKGAMSNLLADGISKAFESGKYALIDYNAQMENSEASFKTLLGSTEKAKGMMKELYDFASTTPFELGDLTGATQKLLAFGIPADLVKGKLKMLGDISQGNAQKLDSLSLALGKISSSGKMTGEELNQMIDAGFNPLDSIAKATGKSQAELRGEMEKGLISYEMITGAMERATSQGGQFYQSMDNQSKTFTGKLSTIKDAFNSNLGEGLKPIFSWLTNTGIPMATNAVSKIPEVFKKVSDAVKFLSDNFNWIAPVITGVLGTITAFSVINGIVVAFQAFQTATAGLTLVQAILNVTMLACPLTWIAIVIGAVIAGAVALAMNWDTVKQKAVELWKGLTEVWNGILKTISDVVTVIVTFITSNFSAQILSVKSIFTSIQLIIENVWTIIKNIFIGAILLIVDLFKGDFGALQNHAKQIMENISTAIGSIWENIKNIFVQYVKLVITNFSQLIGGVGSVIGKVKDAVVSGMNQAINFLLELPSKMLDIGKSIVQGLIDGIKSMIGNVAKIVGDLADSITKKIKSALGIKSPSRVMMEVGEYTAEGLAIGIENQRDMVINAMKGISADIKVGASTITTQAPRAGGSITIINQGTIVGTNGMNEFADIISRKISGKYGLSLGGSY